MAFRQSVTFQGAMKRLTVGLPMSAVANLTAAIAGAAFISVKSIAIIMYGFTFSYALDVQEAGLLINRSPIPWNGSDSSSPMKVGRNGAKKIRTK
jgi:hypothetical protein